ncbi:MAG: dTMP kinase [Malacoplasma sp.]
MKLRNINFITFEGIDGSGKSTVLKLINKRLLDLKLNKDIIITREPGGTPLAEKIREIVLGNDMLPITETLLYSASRAEHVNNLIKPEIKKGNIILCDRFLQSSLAYQGFFNKVGYKNVKLLNKFSVGNIKPDLIFFLNISTETSINRLDDRAEKDRFDSSSIERKKILINAYDYVLKKSKNVHYIDGEQKLDVIVNQIFEIITNTFYFQNIIAKGNK